MALREAYTCWIDVETSGLIPGHHAPVQIAGVIARGYEILEKFDVKACIPPGFFADPEALKHNNLTLEEIKKYPPAAESLETLKAIFLKYQKYGKWDDRFWFHAHNAPFDYQMLRKWWEKVTRDKWAFSRLFHFPYRCSMERAGRLLQQVILDPDRKGFKLIDICGYLGIQADDSRTHEGCYDVELMMQVEKKLDILEHVGVDLEEAQFEQDLPQFRMLSELELEAHIAEHAAIKNDGYVPGKVWGETMSGQAKLDF
jgi:DNA polymerase III alpha subunit (gram-positive type)